MFLLPSAVWGQETITVAGVAPDADGHFSDISGVTYDNSTKTLTLSGATVTSDQPVVSDIKDLKVYLYGTNTFNYPSKD